MYEDLIKEAEKENIEVVELDLSERIKGLYSDNIIAINKCIPTNKEKACVLSEELGHHHTSCGDILNQANLCNRKQERIARAWGYTRLVRMSDLVAAFNDGVRNIHELSEYLGVTQEFSLNAIDYYKEKFGLFHELNEYIIYFEPFGIFKKL